MFFIVLPVFSPIKWKFCYIFYVFYTTMVLFHFISEIYFWRNTSLSYYNSGFF
ncbi:hypothetical protein HMPREF9474_02645 [ [[Clostridium] symbiosum WAL-14163]|uniref:Uncharacterized protein n=1 Tax=Clostridium symbiosum (strain WAL-14163) TaxID=742740 RepID=E7GP00_CLOS6|nr:hypothetical protein HMPREF9474_02645 [ [[Clostridium] symbiosum WAL-14163]